MFLCKATEVVERQVTEVDIGELTAAQMASEVSQPHTDDLHELAGLGRRRCDLPCVPGYHDMPACERR